MTGKRGLDLAWWERGGHTCLCISGWTEAEISELSGLNAAQLDRRLAVLPTEVAGAGVDVSTVQPLDGRFEVGQDAVYFAPKFPFLDGRSYSLAVGLAPEDRPVHSCEVWKIQRPAPEGEATTEVVAIYPTAGELPVNQLKLYIHFSSPMSEDWAGRAVHVRRGDNDEPLDGVFLSMDPELWDRERRRLTLLLDPGRIKRGLVPNAEAGYPLIEGIPVIFTIDDDFRDAAGRPLRASQERRYDIGPPVRVRVDPADWQYRFPTLGSADPLVVEFDRPLDHALLNHSLWVHDAEGRALAGLGDVGPGERSWLFEPKSPWQQGRHLLMIDPRLEDLAGNSLIRVFDRDLSRSEDAPTDSRFVAVEFTLGASVTAPP